MPEDWRPTLDRLHAHLAATAERPVVAGPSRWLGEAEAVVSDVADGDAPTAAVRTRVEQARHLLAHVDETGDDEADEHVREARRLVEELLAELAGEA